MSEENEDLKRQVFDFLKDVPMEEESVTSKETEQLKRQLQRVAADFENYKRRATEQQKENEQTKVREFLFDFLPIVDDLLRVKKATQNEGFDMIINNLCKVLKDWNIQIVPSVGEEFNPNYHEVLAAVENNLFPSNVIAEEIKRGYIMNGKLLRAAQVIVSL